MTLREAIVGNWNVIFEFDDVALANAAVSDPSDIEAFLIERQILLEDSPANLTIEFRDDGTAESIGEGEPTTGKWSVVNEADDLLTIQVLGKRNVPLTFSGQDDFVSGDAMPELLATSGDFVLTASFKRV